jgi:molybdenum cofactor cytidylyltransferase
MIGDPTIRNIAIVILAAGQSARLGSPKQLLSYNNKTLLENAVDTALETECASIFVVLGANNELLRKELKTKPVIVLENADWEEGMASSIRCGLKYITGTILRPDSIIFMVCDQPFVSSGLLLELLNKKNETRMPIVASDYGNKLGTPALFHRSMFETLLELKGDTGARKILVDNVDKVATVSFPDGITDIDTKEDYDELKTKY